MLEIIKTFEKVSGKKLPYKIVERRAGDLAKVYANPEKAEKELGRKAELTVETAIRDTLNYLSKTAK